jgi:hypothetical protein
MDGGGGEFFSTVAAADPAASTVLFRAANPRGPGGSHRTPSDSVEDPLGLSSDRESVIGNAPTLVPGPLARLQDLQLLAELSPQVIILTAPCTFH